MPEEILVASLCRHIGQTVTIFTSSGGLSGSGFTGTLAGVSGGVVRLITSIGAPPSCPVGSSCAPGLEFGNFYGGFGGGRAAEFAGFNNWLGSITNIPLCAVVSFTHNAI